MNSQSQNLSLKIVIFSVKNMFHKVGRGWNVVWPMPKLTQVFLMWGLPIKVKLKRIKLMSSIICRQKILGNTILTAWSWSRTHGHYHKSINMMFCNLDKTLKVCITQIWEEKVWHSIFAMNNCCNNEMQCNLCNRNCNEM